jgi:bis(5'-nucleosyl)-tetraphosphatase (symmetrical)
MATYAIGDIQGCYSSLERLADVIRFDPARDRLWFVGDLVNRGADSLSVLRYIKGLGPAAVTVLGNHDLHLLAVAEGISPSRQKDTFQEILTAADREDLLQWLRRQPLLHRERSFVLIHAGLLPQWTTDQACALAQEVEHILRSDGYRDLLTYLYKAGYASNAGPQQWSDDLAGMERWGVIANALTKLRVCSPEGKMHLSYKGTPDAAPSGFLPWFEVPGRKSADDATVVFGHWAAMGLRIKENVLAIDSGCVYGRQLTATRLEDRQLFQVSCTTLP